MSRAPNLAGLRIFYVVKCTFRLSAYMPEHSPPERRLTH